MWKLLLLIPLLFVLGCPSASTPTPPLPPDPPQVTVLKLTNLGATANNTAAHTLRVLCAPDAPAAPVLDEVTCSNTAVYLRLAARTFDKVAAVATSTDAWSVQRIRIAQVGAGVATNVAIKDPTLRSQVDAVVDIVTLILEVK
jgi:hypothetical protein